MLKSLSGGGEFQILIGTIFSGIAFVGSRHAMENGLGPFTYNAWRHVVSTLVLISCKPWLDGWYLHSSNAAALQEDECDNHPSFDVIMKWKKWCPRYIRNMSGIDVWMYGTVCGIATFFASAFIQVGLVEVSAGKTAFISGLFVVVIPVMEKTICRSQSGSVTRATWISAILSGIGMYFLSGSADEGADSSSTGTGEFMVFCGMICWALSIMGSDMGAKRVNCISLTCIEFFVTTLFCLASAYAVERNLWSNPLAVINQGWEMFILVGCAEAGSFTLTTLGQISTSPSRAALLMSLEAVTACVLGYFFLGEVLEGPELLGCAIMLFATVLPSLMSSSVSPSLLAENSIGKIKTSSVSEKTYEGAGRGGTWFGIPFKKKKNEILPT